MSRGLDSAIRDMFRGERRQFCISSWRQNNPHNPNVKYIEIPIKEDIFEIPIFALDTFTDCVRNGTDENTDAIVVTLNTNECVPRYATVDRNMRDVLLELYKSARLVLLNVKQGDDVYRYYGTGGAVFDEQFEPLVICSWQIERYLVEVVHDDESTTAIVKYRFLRPIIRINPSVYLNKADSMQKWIVNKLLSGCLSEKVYSPYCYNMPDNIGPYMKEFSVKVEIDNNPFIIHKTDTPSISTTNQQLLQLVTDHIDELIQ